MAATAAAAATVAPSAVPIRSAEAEAEGEPASAVVPRTVAAVAAEAARWPHRHPHGAIAPLLKSHAYAISHRLIATADIACGVQAEKALTPD